MIPSAAFPEMRCFVFPATTTEAKVYDDLSACISPTVGQGSGCMGNVGGYAINIVSRGGATYINVMSVDWGIIRSYGYNVQVAIGAELRISFVSYS